MTEKQKYLLKLFREVDESAENITSDTCWQEAP